MYSLFFFLSKLIVLSSAIGYISGLINSYIFSKQWVFNHKESQYDRTFYKFIIIYLIGGILNSLTIFILDKLDFQYVLSWLIGNGLAVLNNFFGSKLFVFNKH